MYFLFIRFGTNFIPSEKKKFLFKIRMLYPTFWEPLVEKNSNNKLRLPF